MQGLPSMSFNLALIYTNYAINYRSTATLKQTVHTTCSNSNTSTYNIIVCVYSKPRTSYQLCIHVVMPCSHERCQMHHNFIYSYVRCITIYGCMNPALDILCFQNSGSKNMCTSLLGQVLGLMD